VNNLTLNCAYEMDETAKAKAIAECTNKSIINVPWLRLQAMNGNTTSTQSTSMILQPTDGLYCQRILVAAFPPDQSGVVQNDHSNAVGAASDDVYNGKFRSFFTSVDGQRLQVDDISCVPPNPSGENAVTYPSMDYTLKKSQYESSVIQSLAMHQLNWTWLDSFLGSDNPLDESKGDALGGLDLNKGTGRGRMYTFTVPATVQKDNDDAYPALFWYFYAVCTKRIKLGPQGSDIGGLEIV